MLLNWEAIKSTISDNIIQKNYSQELWICFRICTKFDLVSPKTYVLKAWFLVCAITGKLWNLKMWSLLVYGAPALSSVFPCFTSWSPGSNCPWHHVLLLWLTLCLVQNQQGQLAMDWNLQTRSQNKPFHFLGSLYSNFVMVAEGWQTMWKKNLKCKTDAYEFSVYIYDK